MLKNVYAELCRGRLDNNYIAANGVQCLATSLEVNTGLRDLRCASNSNGTFAVLFC